MSTWLDIVLADASPRASQVLPAFPGQALRSSVDDLPDDLPITRQLVGVDRDQAALFHRRWRATRAVLAGLDHPDARLYEIALVCRAEEILAAPGPRALRIRALVDYYTSHASLVRHHDPAAPDLADLPVQWTQVAPGLEHGRLVGRSSRGPIHANLLRCRGLRLKALHVGGARLADVVAAHGALAGTSGGFFLYSEPDIRAPSQRLDPVGLLISEGQMVNLPHQRRSALLCDGARQSIARVGLDEVGLRGWSRAHGRHAPAEGTVVVGTRAHGRGREIPLNGSVIEGWTGAWQTPWRNAMAGGPRLLDQGQVCLDRHGEDLVGSAPPLTFSADETFDENLLPRLGAGLQPDGTLVFAAVDGRDPERAPGVRLQDLARLLARQGCTEALNLDGGSSKRMVVDGRVVDLPSTEVVTGVASAPRVRPVHTALLLLPR
jgi:hypothetical protein